MIERVKTFLLIALIAASFALSGYLWNIQPRLDNLGPSRYIAPQLVGHTVAMADLIKPSAVVFHTGDGRHLKAAVDTVSYKAIIDNISKWDYYNFTVLKPGEEDWDRLLNKRRGIEMIYRAALPLDVFNRFFNSRSQLDAHIPEISRVWFYESREQNASYILYISDADKTVVQARTSLSSHDFEAMFKKPIAEHLPEQMVFHAQATAPHGEGHPYMRPIYLPKSEGTAWRYRQFFQPLTIRQVIATLFVDPSLTREVTERDGTMIYTDGSRLVSLPRSQRYLLYRDAMQQSSGGQAVAGSQSLETAIDFVNQHGGWTGDYSLEHYDDQQHKHDSIVYQFRQQIQGYPLFSGDEGQSIMAVETDGSAVFGFQRPMLQLDTYFERVPVHIKSGTELLNELVHRNVHQKDITGIELGYKENIVNDYMVVQPVWVIHRGANSPLLIDAIKTEEGGSGNGLG
ncbi:two-component system activity regulator YycH [Aneurinibacillus sp. Ricciae_BoGa-3]|uniref:YycH family regulatory protein n=1 Tax=Aneurinibacillus sp. Ricciae_BoGa-3 TaxID=3022697 RepID=UPI002340F626|nr:two-component system activity regulator YycH [Aneurinibacillus sp. Ricciae_BoGa-3]WCK54499.1 two-component system activity regulator YycH [Aneurinibacillus sp. Ricciae_BoGa-3]